MKQLHKKIQCVSLALMLLLILIADSHAMMGSTTIMTNSSGFGMMNGMAGTPVVGNDGTAYLIIFNSTSNAGSAPTSNSFESSLVAVKTSGESTSLTFKGLLSKPVVVGNALVATASLPDFSNYSMMGNYGVSSTGQSVLYVISLPMSGSSVPVAVSMTGGFASMPVIANNYIYVTATDYGNAMMESNNMFYSMYGNYNFNYNGSATSYLYMFNFDGTVFKKIEIK